eukprot:731028-Amphidinium_carterae.1
MSARPSVLREGDPLLSAICSQDLAIRQELKEVIDDVSTLGELMNGVAQQLKKYVSFPAATRRIHKVTQYQRMLRYRCLWERYPVDAKALKMDWATELGEESLRVAIRLRSAL